ncbi:MAG TPA: pyridoxal-phosphate dependent enzyme [Chloroflexota bacterium]|jgi:threonine synthase|nr:pyridoxal-phosphate dependent enzyme [Chloroflexota bacterium]
MSFELYCEACGRPVAPTPYRPRCVACGGALGFRYTEAAVRVDRFLQGAPARRMWDYGALLPVEHPEAPVTLDEGGTALVRASGGWGCRLWLKDETRNPTGSHKDRALSVAITRGRELGFRSCVIVSAGSTGLSTAAYAARAGMRCALIAPRGTPDERLLPAALYGATLFEAPGTFDDALRLVEAIAERHPLYLTSTARRSNPYQAEGTRTIGFEIAAQLAAAGERADWIVVPTGGGGTVAGIWRAYGELRQLGALPPGTATDSGARLAPLPRLATVQPATYNALEIALARGLSTDEELYALGISEETPTVQAKLQHGVPPDAGFALAALRESGGTATSVSDAAALAAQRRLASAEGIFAEPSAAAALAGVERLVAEGTIKAHETVVTVVTGSGFRELGSLAGQVAVERHALTAEALTAL